MGDWWKGAGLTLSPQTLILPSHSHNDGISFTHTPPKRYALPTLSLGLCRNVEGASIMRLHMKPIPGFPGYFADCGGNVYSDRIRGHSKGVTHIHRLKAGVGRNGYRRVTLALAEKTVYRYVHHLILETFVGPRPSGMECCHGPKGKTDNSTNNLSWGTRKKNHGPDRLRDGSDQRGEKNRSAKLNEMQVRVIRRAYSWRGRGFGLSAKQLAEIFCVAPPTVHCAAHSLSWAWLR